MLLVNVLRDVPGGWVGCATSRQAERLRLTLLPRTVSGGATEDDEPEGVLERSLGTSRPISRVASKLLKDLLGSIIILPFPKGPAARRGSRDFLGLAHVYLRGSAGGFPPDIKVCNESCP